ncbi:hypothetical protein HGD90_06620 [Rhodobacteraceae bacterium R_SAG7]|nr:hypothetical protein [Rhodobacteraceae bacterium R_SAG7]
MAEEKVIAAYEAATETGWAIVDARGCTRPASAEEAQRFHQVPNFHELAAARRLSPGSKGASR